MNMQRAAAGLVRRAPPLRIRSSAARERSLRSDARRRRWRCSPPSMPRGEALAFRRKRLADLAEEERRLRWRRQCFASAQLPEQLQEARRRAPASAARWPGRCRAAHPAAVIEPGDCSSCRNTKLRTIAGKPRPRACWLRYRRAPLPPAGRTARLKDRPFRSRGRRGTDRCARGRSRRSARPSATCTI